MCGRYRLSRRKQIVEERFDSVSGEEDWGPRYNVAPTQPVPVIRQNSTEPVRELSLMKWGLIPGGHQWTEKREIEIPISLQKALGAKLIQISTAYLSLIRRSSSSGIPEPRRKTHVPGESRR